MEEIDDIVKEFEDYKASLFTLSRLPGEILMKIFRYVEVIEDTYPALEYTLPIFNILPVCKNFLDLGWRSMENRFLDDKYMIWRIMWRNPPEHVLRKMVELQTIDMTTRSSDVFTFACGGGYTDFVENLLQHPQVNPNRFGNEALKNASANGHVEVVRLLLADHRVNPPDSDENSAIRSASKEGQVAVVKLLMEDHRVNPADNDNEAIVNASSNGHVGVVRILLGDKRVDAGVKQNIAFRQASKNGHLEVVKILLKNRKVDPGAESNEAIREATVYGHIEVVKQLLADERVDPSAWENMAVRTAAERGHLRLLKLLLDDERVNPADLGNESLKRASQEGLMEVVKLLLDDYRVIFAEGLKDAGEAATKKGHLEIAKLISRREKNRELFKEAKELFGRIKERLSKEMASFTSGASSIVKMRGVVLSLCEEKAKLMKGLDTEDLPERMKKLNDELERELSSIREIGVYGRETHIYFGDISNDRPHGRGKIYVEKKGARLGSLSAKIRVIYDGEFVNGHRHGKGIEFYEKGKGSGQKRYEGFFVKGKKEGQGMEWYPNQRKAYEGGWKAGKRHGMGTLWPPKKPKHTKHGEDGVMKGEWKAGNLHKIDIDSVNLEEVDFSKLSKFFKRKRKIGQGAFGEVFRVMWKGKKAAAKVLNVSSQFRNAVLERTEETLKLCASLHHPQIIKIFGWCKKGEIGYLMELCTSSVADLIQPEDITQRIDVSLKVQYIYQTALGMNYLHSHSIMHRDLKWENILLGIDGDIRITDFDFAMDEMWQSSVNMSSVGTPAFIAPEVVKGEDYSNKCDVYSFALMIYCLLFETLMPYQDLKQCNCGMSQFSSHTFLQHVCNCNLRPPVPGPAGMPEAKWKWLIDLMMVCWDTKVSKRPDFKQIVGIIESNMKDHKLFTMINVRTTENVDSESEKFLLTQITLDGLRNAVERRWEDIDTIYVQTSVGLVEMRNDEQVKRLNPDELLVVKLLKMEEEEVTTETLGQKIEELEKDNEQLKKRVLDLKGDNDKLKKDNFELRMLVRGQEKEVTSYKDETVYLRDLNDKLVKILQEQKDAANGVGSEVLKEEKKVLVAEGYDDDDEEEEEEEKKDDDGDDKEKKEEKKEEEEEEVEGNE